MSSLSIIYSTDVLIYVITTFGSIVCCWLLGIKLFSSSTPDSSSSPDLFNKACKRDHDYRRFKTYPSPVPNTWYHLIDSDEVRSDDQKVIYVRCIGQNFAIWRSKDGEPIVMNAYCPHMGANLGVGGVITDNDCIKCPFHEWEFDKNGKLQNIPYIEKEKVDKIRCKPIHKYIAKDFCGGVYVYFHADPEELPDNKPEFELPAFIQEEINSAQHQWHLHTKHDIGHVELSCIDWVDQSGDHGHFHTLHSRFFWPYTRAPLPAFINDLIGITHDLTTIIGNKWIEKLHGKKDPYYGDCNCKYYIYFLDKAGITWKGNVVESSKSLTKEFYIGPAFMIFHIPLKSMGLGSIKLFVTTTPTLNNDGHSGGSVMRIRVWLSDYSWSLRFVSWFIVGIATSQLLSDIDILCNKIRKKKPCITRKCGPYNIVNTWLKSFYSKSSPNVGKADLDW